jgi:hypothetical protein
MASSVVDVAEQKRLNDAREAAIPWKIPAQGANRSF